MKKLNHYVAIYKEQLQKGDILIAYDNLVNFVMQLRVDLMKNHSNNFSFTGILHGYLDYTYFYYSNDFLKDKKLKLGVVLNHVDMQFEIWLLGNTISKQKEYWELLKNSKWNKDRKEMPKYSVLVAVLEDNPDFDDLPLLSKTLDEKFVKVSTEIIDTLTKLS